MRPLVRCGADSPFGLALPAAHPTASQLYAPRGVWFDDHTLIVCDSGNHRVLIWHGLPTEDGRDADVVLGQADFTSEGPGAGGRLVTNGLHLPTAVTVLGGHLFVADAWHHRVLVWDEIPRASATPPAWALGQASLDAVQPNADRGVAADTLYWPYGLGMTGDIFWVADTGNRRVLGWHGVPSAPRAADVVLGQPDFAHADENRGGAPTARSFRWPHAIAGNGDVLYVADAGNHRVLGWTPVPAHDREADVLLGQRAFTENVELPHRAQGAHRFRFPYSVATSGTVMAVADTANNRVLLWDELPHTGVQRPADRVLGQLDFDAAGENRWKAVTADSLCWPYGLWLHGDRLAIADSGNNRVMLWDVQQAAPPTEQHAATLLSAGA